MGYCVGVDLDDTLMDFNSALCRFYNRHYGGSMSRESVFSFDLELSFNLSTKEVDEMIEQFLGSEEHLSAKPLAEAVPIVRKLSEQFEIFVVTARPQTANEHTYRWLAKHYPFLMDRVHFTGGYNGQPGIPKSEVCRRLELNVFVDDAPKNIQDVEPEVSRAFLIDAPWNQDYRPGPKIRRVFSWPEIWPEIQNIILPGP